MKKKAKKGKKGKSGEELLADFINQLERKERRMI
jgi:hypothetical protein